MWAVIWPCVCLSLRVQWSLITATSSWTGSLSALRTGRRSTRPSRWFQVRSLGGRSGARSGSVLAADHHPRSWEHLSLCPPPGVVETGLFVGMAERAYFGMEDGSVQVRDPAVNWRSSLSSPCSPPPPPCPLTTSHLFHKVPRWSSRAALDGDCESNCSLDPDLGAGRLSFLIQQVVLLILWGFKSAWWGKPSVSAVFRLNWCCV